MSSLKEIVSERLEKLTKDHESLKMVFQDFSQEFKAKLKGRYVFERGVDYFCNLLDFGGLPILDGVQAEIFSLKREIEWHAAQKKEQLKTQLMRMVEELSGPNQTLQTMQSVSDYKP